MRFNPLTQELFTNAGQLVKQLHCPLARLWQQLIDLKGEDAKLCNSCQINVLDTASMTDAQLKATVQDNPNTCLKVDLNQANLNITYGYSKSRQ